jgi:propionyl-CoA carboxylase beta chain
MLPEQYNRAVRHPRNSFTPVVTQNYFFEVPRALRSEYRHRFARLGGYSVGVVATNRRFLAGVVDIDASVQAARFVRFCDCFNIPLINFEDVPVFCPASTRNISALFVTAQNSFTLCRSDRPENYGYHAQGLRRRILRDGIETHSN